MMNTLFTIEIFGKFLVLAPNASDRVGSLCEAINAQFGSHYSI